jgi:hypothetical protein
LQRGLSAVEMWCEHWNIKIIEDKTQTIYFSQRLRSTEAHLTLKGQNIPFVSYVKYLSVIFEWRLTWRQHVEIMGVKAFRIFTRIYSLSKLSV